MAVKEKSGFKPDPVIWARPCPGVPGLSEMPPHQAKEGALLMIEAGAQPYSGLVKLAVASSHFTMDDALQLSADRAERIAAAAAADQRQRQIAAGRLKVIEPKAKAEDAEDAARKAHERARQRERMALSRFPVKRKDGLGAALLLVLLGQGGQAQFTTRFLRGAGFDAVSVANVSTKAKRLAADGALTCISRGAGRNASIWELTVLGRQNAVAIRRLKEALDAEKA